MADTPEIHRHREMQTQRSRRQSTLPNGDADYAALGSSMRNYNSLNLYLEINIISHARTRRTVRRNASER
jgi:hypothetical protein